MESDQNLILIDGIDRTDSVASFRFQGGRCAIIYHNSPKTYHYRAENVRLLKLQKRINAAELIIRANGIPLSKVDEILDFGPYYRLVRTGRKALTYSRSQVEFHKNCLTESEPKTVFDYFKETAATISLVSEDGFNILRAQYDRVEAVSDDTALSCYLDLSQKPVVRTLPQTIIYPFGLNQSQKTAVENALSSQISIIQGPPGTGKTQTILNL